MDPFVLLLVGLVLISVLVGVTVARGTGRRSGGTDLEPPPARRPQAPVEERRKPTPHPEHPSAGGSATADAPTAPAPPERIPEPGEEEEVDADLVAEVEEALAPPARPSFRERLGKARELLSGAVSSLLSRGVDDETWDEVEEALIRADVGVEVTTALVEKVRTQCNDERITDGAEVLALLKAEMKSLLDRADRSLRHSPGDARFTPVWLFVGVNGVGKTTTIGKVGRRLGAEGCDVVMAAGDTFRAAAAEQLGMWSERVGAELVRGSEGGDPGSVVFDAVQRAAAKGHDIVLADTAGRLHTKVNLMEELRKVRRVADKEPGEVVEVLLVIDATTGQNGLVQATQFAEAVDVTGVVLTKLDGTAKGGICLAIERQLGIPVKLVGLGEGPDDLVDFDPDEFVEALFA